MSVDPTDVIADAITDSTTGYYQQVVPRAAAIKAVDALTAAGFRVVPAPDDDTRQAVADLVADHIHAGDVARSHDTPDLDPDEQAALRRIVRFHDRTAELLEAAYLGAELVAPPRREVPEVLVSFAKWADWYLEDGCRRDHHGYCQSHGLDEDCPVGPMREWLAAYLEGDTE